MSMLRITSVQRLSFLAIFICCSSSDSITSTSAEHFIFGTSSAAWQYEGNLNAGGRGPSIWDDFCGGRTPSGVANCHGGIQAASTADNQYNLTTLAKDIQLMKSIGTTAYRLSLSWSRIMPTGRLPINMKGVNHYKKVLQMLHDANIDPWVTLYHFDLPSSLEKEENGWLNETIISHFELYASVCFYHYNKYVKRWITINEGHTIATAGYLYGNAAPGRCSNRSFCSKGNGTTEPYIVAHNILRAHARAVYQYRNVFNSSTGSSRGDSINNKGDITMVISGDWTEPWNNSNPLDVAASQRRQEYQIGWFADPLYFGHYPLSMTKNGVGGSRLPIFTKEESRLIKGSVDYFALNHYTSRFGKHANYPPSCIVGSGGANVTGGKGWDEDQCCKWYL